MTSSTEATNTVTGLSKRERFLAAAHLQEVDRPPVGAWIHYHSASFTPRETADAHLAFQRTYDWDYLKVMHDYRLAVPAGLEEVARASDLDRVGDPSLDYVNFDAQREVLTILHDELPDVPLIDTLFSPIQTVVRALGASAVPFFQADPALAHAVLGRVALLLAEYVSGLSALGVDGLYFAVTGAGTDASALGLTSEQFADFVAPYDSHVLEAAEGLVRIIHLHGENLKTDLVVDYPGEVLSWSDRVSRPTIAEVAASGVVPMVGLDEVASIYWTPSQTVADVQRSRAQASDRIIVAPNCTVHSDVSPTVLRALRASVELPLAG
jgi:uroporphyrinogen decarboxylase